MLISVYYLNKVSGFEALIGDFDSISLLGLLHETQKCLIRQCNITGKIGVYWQKFTHPATGVSAVTTDIVKEELQ
jgi:hypothetical protein